MNASVLVCTYNRAEMLAASLRSLAQLSVPPEFAWEVLIVDNNSTDNTRGVAEAFAAEFPGRFRYVFESRQGKSFALNTAIREARGEILAFTDDDATVDQRWLAELIAAIEKFDCAGVGGKIVPVWDSTKPDWLVLDGPYKLMDAVVSLDLGPEPIPIKTAVYGVNMAFRRDVFQKYGDFRKDLGPTVGSEVRGEDSEFCRRLVKAGEMLVYVPGAVVYHPVEKKRMDKQYFQAWYLGRGRASVREGGIPSDAVRYFGIPRYLLGSLGRNLLRWLFCPSATPRFHHKLSMYETWGQILESRTASLPTR